MERQTKTGEIFRVFEDDPLKIYNILNNRLEYNPFAKLGFGAGFYEWKDNRYEWIMMTSASESEQVLIELAFVKLKDEVAKQFDNKITDRLFTIPDKSYIYYCYDGEQLRLLLTGWGFKFPPRSKIKSDIIDIDLRDKLTLSFLYDGKRLCNYDFGLQLPKQLKRLSTNANGVFEMLPRPDGTILEIKDFNSGKTFMLEIIAGKLNYELDVTRFITLSLVYDGRRLCDYDFGLEQDGQLKRLKTGADGLCELPMPAVGTMLEVEDFNSGNTLSVEIVEEQSHYDIDVTRFITLSLVYDGRRLCDYEFGLQQDGQFKRLKTGADGLCKLPMPAVGTMLEVEDFNSGNTLPVEIVEGQFHYDLDVTRNSDIHFEALHDGQPVADEEIAVVCGGKSYTVRTGSDGTVTLTLPWHENSTIEATMRGTTQTEDFKVDGNDIKFVFETPKPEPEKPQPFTPTLIIAYDAVTADGHYPVAKGYPVSVECDGHITDYVSDDNGVIRLPEMTENKTMKVIDGRNPAHVGECVFDADHIYRFLVPVEAPSVETQVKVMFRDYKGRPLKCDRVCFRQDDGHELNATLDSNGDIQFAKSALETGEPIDVEIIGASRPFDYVRFIMDDEEDVYLLQEQRNGSPWWMLLLQVLAVLLILAGLFVLWHYFTWFIEYLFDEIYH